MTRASRRLAAALVAAAVMVAACSTTADDGPATDAAAPGSTETTAGPTPTEGSTSATTSGGAGPGLEPTPSPGGDGTGGDPPPAPSPDTEAPEREGPTTGSGSPGAAAVRDDGPLGTAGPALLGDAVSRAVVEVDHTSDASLTIDPVDVVARHLERYGAKRTAREAVGVVPAQDVYSGADLRRLAAERRSSRSSSDVVSIYVLVLSGRFEQERVTGVAFEATSFAIFPDQIGGGLLGLDRRPYETAVVTHELGHLLGLVNLTGHGAFHEDPDHPGHARSRGSVMYWAIEDTTLTSVFGDGPPVDFDADDREEMARIRAAA